MPDDEALSRLAGGAASWNAWHRPPNARPDLSHARLARANLSGVSFGRVDLAYADLRYADLRGADLTSADLLRALLCNADLRGANLDRARVSDSDLTGANAEAASFRQAWVQRSRLNKVNLDNTDFTGAHLQESDFTLASARHARFCAANLSAAILRACAVDGADLTSAIMGNTVLDDIDLLATIGLESVQNVAPSALSIRTTRRFSRHVHASFLATAGLNDVEMQYARIWERDLTPQQLSDITYALFMQRDLKSLQISGTLLSYSHADTEFVEALEAALHARRFRCWRDVHHLVSGRMDTQIERAIQMTETVVLVLSKDSVKSDWVRWEAAKAREREKIVATKIMHPISLDDAWKTSDWPGPLREQIQDNFIIDFSLWREPDAFRQSLQRLYVGLRVRP